MLEAIALGVFGICVLVAYVALRLAYEIGYNDGHHDGRADGIRHAVADEWGEEPRRSRRSSLLS